MKAAPAGQYDAVVIVGSIGGIQALSTLLSSLPADFPIPIFVVQHRSSAKPSLLTHVLRRSTPLRVKNAEYGDKPVAGTVYVAPPDRHLVITPRHTVELLGGSRVRHLLSAGDPLFKSAAQAYGSGVIAVVLTGLDANGAAGVTSVKNAGGVVLAQDEATSEAFEMPKAAIETGAVDEVLPIQEIGPELVALAKLGARTA